MSEQSRLSRLVPGVTEYTYSAKLKATGIAEDGTELLQYIIPEVPPRPQPGNLVEWLRWRVHNLLSVMAQAEVSNDYWQLSTERKDCQAYLEYLLDEIERELREKGDDARNSQ